MNIFKILASGDGKIFEPSISAFLAYLLDPKKDHGLGDSLILKIMNPLVSNSEASKLADLKNSEGYIQYLYPNPRYEIEVFLEQAFVIEGKPKQIVDIVILLFENNLAGKESYVKLKLEKNNEKKLKHIFLIENKIKDISSSENQLKSQFNAALSTLNELNLTNQDIKNIISLIYISPLGDNSKKAYSELIKNQEGISSIHLAWRQDDTEDSTEGISILSMIKEILKDESTGNHDAINEQTKFLLKSFANFIENDFQSDIEEESKGRIQRKIYDRFEELLENHNDLFSTEIWDIVKQFQSDVSEKYRGQIDMRFTPNHIVSVFTKNFKKKLFSITLRSKNSFVVQIIYKNFEISDEKRKELEKYLSLNNLSYRVEERLFEIQPSESLKQNVSKIFDFFISII